MGKRDKSALFKPDAETAKLMKLSAGEQVAAIKKGLGYLTFEKPPKYWLNLGSRRLNKVFGSPDLGIAYGKSITLAGPYSSGKTLIAMIIAALAQQDGAKIGYVDIENSADADWAKMHGLDFGKQLADGSWSKVALFQPEVGVFGKTKKNKTNTVRMQTAEELFTVAERWVLMQRAANPKGKLCLLVDSTTAIIPEEEMAGEYVHQNMRTNVSLAVFLNRLTKRWTQVALNSNAIVIYISQLRINPGQMFGNPERIPGGNGVLFYPSIVNKVKRVSGGLMKKGDTPIGVMSVITNMKNKVGGGSVEGLKCGVQLWFHKDKMNTMSAADLKKLAKKNKGGGEE